ncbi:hypothetical protein KY321_03955 [Candidatus Woesearchaeota archaeon]|nr:hypothetical protein [Candidatus Woesearchaeota archaeon]
MKSAELINGLKDLLSKYEEEEIKKYPKSEVDIYQTKLKVNYFLCFIQDIFNCLESKHESFVNASNFTRRIFKYGPRELSIYTKRWCRDFLKKIAKIRRQ